MNRRLTGTGSDAGLSLSELLIAMMIMSIVLVAATTALVATARQFRATDGKTDTQSDSRLLLEAITRDIRVAVPNPGGGGPFGTAGPDSLTVYTAKGAADARPLQVTYAVDPTSRCMRRTEIKPSGNSPVVYPAGSATSRCVSFSKVDTSQPVFSYTTIAPGGVTAPANLPADLDSIGSVQVRLSLTSADRPEVPPTVVNRSVTIINQSNSILRGK